MPTTSTLTSLRSIPSGSFTLPRSASRLLQRETPDKHIEVAPLTDRSPEHSADVLVLTRVGKEDVLVCVSGEGCSKGLCSGADTMIISEKATTTCARGAQPRIYLLEPPLRQIPLGIHDDLALPPSAAHLSAGRPACAPARTGMALPAPCALHRLVQRRVDARQGQPRVPRLEDEVDVPQEGGEVAQGLGHMAGVP